MDAGPSQPCAPTTALDVIGGKWHLIVLYPWPSSLAGSTNCGDRPPVSATKVLTQTVRHLETHGLVGRSVGTDASPCVQYALSERGHTVRPILTAVVDWGHAHLAADVVADQEG